MSTDTNDQATAADSARVQQFRAEIDELKLKGGSAENEKRLLALGVLLMVVGLGLVIYGAIQVGRFGGSPADQRAYMAQGSYVGLALVIAGGVLFVRYSIARYLRFWLIRSTYEQRTNADRIVDAIERASGLSDGVVEAPVPQVVVPTPPPAPPVPPAPVQTAPPAPTAPPA